MRITLYTLLVFFIGLTTKSFGQNVENPGDYPVPYDEDEEMIIYDGVVDMKGTDKKTLYNRFMEWGKSHFTNFDGKITDKNADGDVPFIRYKGYKELEYEEGGSDRIWYYMKTQFKDDRYRYSIKKIHKRGRSYFGLEKWMDTNITSKEVGIAKCKVLDEAMKELIKNMKEYMANPPEEEDDSW